MVEQTKTSETLLSVIHQFRDRPEVEALRYRTRFRTFSWTYRETLRAVLKTRSFLQSRGVSEGDPVMIWGPNSPYWVWVYLAAILNKSPAVPMDMGSNLQFVKSVQRETESKILFTSRLNDPVDEGIPEITLETLDETISNQNVSTLPSSGIDPSTTAEIMYTSGTTGTPKGTILTHRNLVANQKSLVESVRIPIREQIRFLSLLPLSHVFEQTVGFWFPVRKGCRVSYLETVKPSEIFAGLKDESPHVIAVVPRLLSLFRDGVLRRAEEQGKLDTLKSMMSFAGNNLPFFLRRLLFRNVHRKFGGNLHYMVVGGAPLDPELEQFWLNLGIEIFQGYGLTETSPILTCNYPGNRKPGTVGKPLPGVDVKLADDGEILARGDNVFPGYYQNEEKTEKVFSDGWFRTGDVGEFDDDGFLRIRGRTKNVIVTSEGMNVYPEDIEKELSRRDSVKDSCVLYLNEKITAVLLLEDPNEDPSTIIDAANSNLSDNQKIQDVKVWPEDDFPRTTTMKIIRREVRERYEDTDEEESTPDIVETTDSILKTLSSVCDRGPDEIAEDDRLGPDLGLSSVDRMELVTYLERELHVDLVEEEVTSSTTVEELREQVEEGGTEQEDRYRRWTRNNILNGARFLAQEFAFFPVLRSVYQLQVTGRDHLQGLESPCVFISNHQSHLDTPAIMDALPGAFSSRMAPAAWEEFFDIDENSAWTRFQKWFLWQFTTIFFNIFTVPQSSGYRRSLQYLGELLDHDWNILFFPEGQRTVDGSMNPFRRGIGIIAREMNVPVVPIRLDGMDRILPRHASFPARGSVTVRIGEPIRSFSRSQSYREIADLLWEKVHQMGDDTALEKDGVPVTFYTKEDCLLCHKAKQKISGIAHEHPIDLNVIDIEQDRELYDQYKNQVPVIYVGDELASKGKFNERRFRRIVRENRA